MIRSFDQVDGGLCRRQVAATGIGLAQRRNPYSGNLGACRNVRNQVLPRSNARYAASIAGIAGRRYTRKGAVMKHALVVALLAAGAVFFVLPDTAAQQAAAVRSTPQPNAKYKVVFQVSDNDPAKWNLALNNAKNVQIDLGKENVEIEIVAYGPGLNVLKAESAVAGRVNGALDDNVAVVACDNTMHITQYVDRQTAALNWLTRLGARL